MGGRKKKNNKKTVNSQQEQNVQAVQDVGEVQEVQEIQRVQEVRTVENVNDTEPSERDDKEKEITEEKGSFDRGGNDENGENDETGGIIEETVDREIEKEKHIESHSDKSFKEIDTVGIDMPGVKHEEPVQELHKDQQEIRKESITEMNINKNEEEQIVERTHIEQKEKTENTEVCIASEVSKENMKAREYKAMDLEKNSHEERKENFASGEKNPNAYHTKEIPGPHLIKEQSMCDIDNNRLDDLAKREKGSIAVGIDVNDKVEVDENEYYIVEIPKKGKNGKVGIDDKKESIWETAQEAAAADMRADKIGRRQQNMYVKGVDEGRDKNVTYDKMDYKDTVDMEQKNYDILHHLDGNENVKSPGLFVESAKEKNGQQNIQAYETDHTDETDQTDQTDQTQQTNGDVEKKKNKLLQKDYYNDSMKEENLYFHVNSIYDKQPVVTNQDAINKIASELRKTNSDNTFNMDNVIIGKGKIKKKGSKKSNYSVKSRDQLFLVKFLCQAKSYNLVKLSKMFLLKKITYKFFDENNILSVFLTPEDGVKNFYSSEDIYKIDNLDIKKNVSLTNSKYIFFIFKNGSVVIWENFKSMKNNDFFINKMIVFINSFSNDLLPLHVVQYDTIYYCEQRQQQRKGKCFVTGGVIYLSNDCLEQKLTVSFALSQSIRLDVHETIMDIAINTLFGISKEIAEKGSCSITKEEVSSMLNIYSSIINVNTVQDFLDIPEYFWNKVQYEHLWFEIYQYMEIPERIKILNKRYNYYKDFLKVITTELYNKKTFHCYWIVVLLLFIHVVALILNDVFF